VKICGIRDQEDLKLVSDSGADAAGFISGITHFSEDALEPEVVRTLVRAAPPYLSTVLVTHLASAAELLDLAEYTGVDTIQLHGIISETEIARVRAGWTGRLTRVVHVDDYSALDRARRAGLSCDAVHLDSRSAERLGGTGQVHDWSISAKIVEELAAHRCPCILAGGLSPENLSEAIETVKPYAVDVNSGTDTPGGKKSPAAIRDFVRIAHQSA